jgi:protein-disulfide isomerase
MRRLRDVLIVLASGALSCGGGAKPPAGPPAAPLSAPPGEEGAAVPISPRDPTWGNRDAPVTIVEFGDLECPFTARASATLAQLKQVYGPERLRIVWKNYPLPFHQNARRGAEWAMGIFELAGSEAFWSFAREAFKGATWLTSDKIAELATAAGVADPTPIRVAVEAKRFSDPVDADLREAKALGVQGTPTFFMNGISINGAQPFDNFKKAIDEQLTKANEKIEAGVAKDRVYAELARENFKPGAKHAPDTTTVFKVPLGRSPVRGDPNALVTIVEFADFQNPFCARVEPTLKELTDKYGAELRLVWKNYPQPFHKEDEPAAEAAIEVRAERGDKAFWELHDRIFAAQKDLSDDVISRLAAEVGADPARVRHAMTAQTHKDEIGADHDLGGDFRATGTPHFFIDGRRLIGAQPATVFEAIIDEEIVKAKRLVATGTAPSAVYERLTQDGVGPR